MSWVGYRPFPVERFYPAEMAVPQVRDLHAYFCRHDTHTLAEISLLNDKLSKWLGPGSGFHPEVQSLSYGETPLPVVWRLLEWTAAGPDDVFLDLGSGCGGPALLASFKVKRAVGVELVPEAVRFAREAARHFRRQNVEFLEQDILVTDLSQANIVYCSATTVAPWLRTRLRRRFEACRPGARIVTVGHSLDLPGMRLLRDERLPISWTGEGSGELQSFCIHRRD